MLLVPTRVAPSRIHGLGLFAVGPIPAGTPFWRFQPGFDRVFTTAEYTALPELAREHLRWYAFLSRETGELIRGGDHSCFMNHADHPNTGAPADAIGAVTTVTLQDLGEGDELTCDYRAFDGDADWKLGRVPPESALGTRATAMPDLSGKSHGCTSPPLPVRLPGSIRCPL